MEARVFDGRFYATTRIRLQLLDQNDNPPQLQGPRSLRISESTPPLLREIAQYTASDKDEGDSIMYVLYPCFFLPGLPYPIYGVVAAPDSPSIPISGSTTIPF
jgi:hypothetical protein